MEVYSLRTIACSSNGRRTQQGCWAPLLYKPAAHYWRLFLVLTAFVIFSDNANGAVTRDIPTVGSIVTISGESGIRFVDTKRWLNATLDQALATGDALQTGPFGKMAILFQDRTELRVHPDTQLAIRYLATAGRSTGRLELDRGSFWARALPSPANEVIVETPAAIAAVRGTDWYVKVGPASTTTLLVFHGAVRLSNNLGSVEVGPGELGTAELGKAPTKKILVTPSERPYWALDLSLDWFNMLSLTGGAVGNLSVAAIKNPVDRAEVLYDRGDYAAARSALADTGAINRLAPNQAKLEMVQGFLLIRQHRFQQAAAMLQHAATGLEGRPRLVTLLGLAGIMMETRQPIDASVELEKVARVFSGAPEVGMARAWLTAFAGRYDAAIAEIVAVRNEFPDNVRASVVAAQIYLLADEGQKVEKAVADAIRADPRDYLAWNWKGIYEHAMRYHPRRALAAYRECLRLNPDYATGWNDLAVLLTSRGEYTEAEKAYQTALRLDPDAALFHANYAIFLQTQERLAAAEQEVERADALEPNQANAFEVRGYLALKRGHDAKAVDFLLKADVADPNWPGIGTSLAIGLYQAGQPDAAERTLSQAASLDPNDQLPPLVSSIIAQEESQVGEAIRMAREAHDRLLRTGTLEVESIASSQSGITNVGSAYANLGLDDWGTYFGDLGFSPYSPGSRFFLLRYYPSNRARQSAITQGLLLDPTAMYSPNRFVQFVNEPGNYLTVTAGIGSEGGALTNNVDVVAQGFARIPTPFAYQVYAKHAHSDGFRNNAQSTTQSFFAGAGGWLDASNYFEFRADYDRQNQGLPGPLDHPDPDDEDTTTQWTTDLGYQHRVSATNRVLLRVAAGYQRERFSNPQPLGVGLSNLDFSLLSTFGLDFTQSLFRDMGLYELDPTLPYLLVTGPVGELFGLPRLNDSLPSNLDLKSLGSYTSRSRAMQLQARHLLQVGNVDLTYGGEYGLIRNAVAQTQTVLASTTLGGILDAGTGVLPESPLLFLYGAPELISIALDSTEHAGTAYIDARWKPNPGLRIQTGAFLHYFGDGLSAGRTGLDPRVGLAWQTVRNHWFRVSARRDFVSPFLVSLAPADTVGLVVPDAFIQEGGASNDYQVRWDAEWSRHVFTFVGVEDQRIQHFHESIPMSSDLVASFDADTGSIRSAYTGIDLWFAERYGLSAIYRHTSTENTSGGSNSRRHLPLIPNKTFTVALNYVGPRQTRMGLIESYVGKRFSDLENSTTLAPYWSTGLRFSWQPDEKRWSISLGVDNIFDRKFELAEGLLTPGRIVLLDVARRL